MSADTMQTAVNHLPKSDKY